MPKSTPLKNILLLHGWGMTRHCWNFVDTLLDDRYKIHSFDLPGHNGSINENLSLLKLDTLIKHLLDITPPQTLWVGWSLGGLIAQLAATQFPKHIPKFVSIAMGARFTSTSNWPAVAPILLQKMHDKLNHCPDDCMHTFIQRQCNQCTPEIQTFLHDMARYPYVLEELNAGLHLLQNIDCRQALANYPGQGVFITGRSDLICPSNTVANSAALCARARCHIVPNAGHALPVSHPTPIVEVIKSCIQ